MRKFALLCVLGLLCSLFVGPAFFAAAPPALASPPPTTSVGDAYATGSGCDWTFGTSGVEQTVAYASGAGSYELTSFENMLDGHEYVQGGTASGQFSLGWNGVTLTGASGGWTCASGTATTPTVGGAPIVQLAVTLTRAGLRVEQVYQIFPSDSVIRQWTVYTNTGSSAATLSEPSFLDQNVMTGDVAAGQVQLQYMTGAECCNAQSWHQQDTTLDSGYARTFDSYDQFGCVDSGSTPASCPTAGYQMGSQVYIPWFSLWNGTTGDGLMAMFDYMGRWQMLAGDYGGGGSLTGILPNYDASVAASASVTSPVATEMTYQGNEDDMTNRLLDYQYRYLWDDTRAGYFASVAAPADWCTGTQWCGQWDQQGIRQKIYGLDNFETAIGINVDWRDNGWWDTPGNWNGPDFRLTNDMLHKSGIKSIIYYPVYGANSNSTVYQDNPTWFSPSAPCASGYTQYQGDLSIPAFATWVSNELDANQQKWGDYEFRNDSCPIQDTTGDKQLEQDQAYRGIVQGFLTTNPGSAYFNVDSGGNEIGLDQVRMTSQQAFYDGTGIDTAGDEAFFDASRLFPVDKISGDPNEWSQNGYCTDQIWADLAMDPSFVSSAFPQNAVHADTTDSQQIECARKLVDTYKYMLAEGVAGRWVRQYHPASSDAGRNWFERLSQDGTKATIHRVGPSTAGTVTVYPSDLSLSPTANYTVSFEFTPGTRTMTGAQINAGITLNGAQQGEIIFINLPGRPGAGSDATAPTAPAAVTATASTDDNYPDVTVSWSAASDNNWVSYYNVYRNNAYLGRVAQGTVYIDHTPGASPTATYGVQAVDGDGNTSATTVSAPAHGPDVVAVDDTTGGLVSYAGSWTHAAGSGGSFDQTLTSSASSSATASYSFTGSSVSAYFAMGPNEGKVNVSVDGTATTLDLYAPDAMNYSIPLLTRAWPTVAAHTITIIPTGTSNAKSSGDIVEFDGLSVRQTGASVTDDPAFSYTGSGWSTTCGTGCDAIDGTLHTSAAAGDTATVTVDASEVRLIGDYCGSCGEADISVDGAYSARVDTYGDRGAAQSHAVIWQDSWPTAGTHTIKITVDGTRNYDSAGTSVSLDAALTDNGTAGPTAASAYTAQVASDAPAGYWRLGDAAGSTAAADSSGNGDTGTVEGGVTFGQPGAIASDPGHTAAAFDGSSGFVDLGNPAGLQNGNATIEAWIKTGSTDSGYHAIAIKWEAYGLFVQNGDLVTYDWSTATEHNSGIDVADGKWHYVALTVTSGGTAVIYVDGSPVMTTTVTPQNQTHDALIGSGSTTGVEYFDGDIDDVAFYPAALSASRIAAHATGATYAAAAQFTSPAGYWRLGDPAGSTTAADASPTGDAGAVHGAVTFGQPGAIGTDPTHTAAAFDGSTGFIDLGNPAALQSNSGTVAAWIKTTSGDSGYHAIALKWYAYGLFVQNGDLVTYDWSTNTEHDSGVSVADGHWHQVALTYQSGVQNGTTLYVDGTPVATTTITAQNQANDALIGSGSTAGVEYFDGDIDDVTFYPNVLTGAQLARLYGAA
jgi:hypothetical protein